MFGRWALRARGSGRKVCGRTEAWSRERGGLNCCFLLVRPPPSRSPRETKWTYDNNRGGFTITTLHRILGGAQVYDSYGQKCNHRFLLNYGFAIENNQEANGFCPNEVCALRACSSRVMDGREGAPKSAIAIVALAWICAHACLEKR